MAYRIRPEVLDKIRTLHGLTSDEQVARLTGLSLGTIGNIRRGSEPSLRTAIVLLNAAEIDDIRIAVEAGATPAA